MSTRTSYFEFENRNKRHVCELEKNYASQNSLLFDKTFENMNCKGLSDRVLPFYGSSESCVVTPTNNHEPINWQIGYSCLDGSQHVAPDRTNTFHNYLVLQTDGSRCSENHQVFNNWTKRKIASAPVEPDAALPLPSLTPEQPLCDVFAELGKPKPYSC